MRNLSINQLIACNINIMSYNFYDANNFSMNSIGFTLFCHHLYSCMQNGPHKVELSELFKQASVYVKSSILQRYEQTYNDRKTRKDEIFEKFIFNLKRYCPAERKVRFYADKQCITPQYLSSVVKGISGQPACEWIDEFVLFEAKALLACSNLSVMEVSDKLGFCDQSSFGKFFRKKTGISPKNYAMRTMKEERNISKHQLYFCEKQEMQPWKVI